MGDATQGLMRLGFTEYEAKAYITLLQQSPLNGYELARESKIPRANIYPVLEKLESRGAIARLESPTGTRYAPIPPNELTQRLNSQMQTSLNDVAEQLSSLGQPLDYEYLWNIRGYTALLEHARALIDGAKHNLLISLSPQESQELGKNIEDASVRGIQINTLCLNACAEECGHCRGHIYRHAVAPEGNHRWLIVVQDEQDLLSGEIGTGEEAQSVRTRQRMLVNLAIGYIQRSIALATLMNDLHGQPEELLSPAARAALQAIDPIQDQGGWLEHVRDLFPDQMPGSASLHRESA